MGISEVQLAIVVQRSVILGVESVSSVVAEDGSIKATLGLMGVFIGVAGVSTLWEDSGVSNRSKVPFDPLFSG